MSLRMALSATLLAALAACSGGSGNNRGQLASLIEIRESVKAQRAAANAPKTQVTRALIEEIDAPLLEVELQSRNITGYFFLHAVRAPVQVWRANDSGQIIVRNGLVTGTRGVGNDLVSSDYAQTLSAISHGVGVAARRYDLRNGLGEQDTVLMTCSFETVGLQTIEIYERTYQTRHIRERCESEDTEAFVNDYWVERKSGLIRQSSQWISPILGHFVLRFLND